MCGGNYGYFVWYRHVAGYLYINRSVSLPFHPPAVLSLTTCPLSLQVILFFSNRNQFIIQSLTVLMIFCMKILHPNGNKEHLLLSSMMVYTFIHVHFHFPIIYRVGLGSPSGTPAPTTKFMPKIPPHTHTHTLSILITGERGGSVVECRTPEREVRGSRPTAAVLCP